MIEQLPDANVIRRHDVGNPVLPRSAYIGCERGILGGGFDARRMYLYEGRPGSGKTTIAMQFLLEGARQGDRILYVALSETERELRLVAVRHGWSLGGIEVFELVPPDAVLDPDRELTVLLPAEVELSETIKLRRSERPSRDIARCLGRG